MSGTLLDKWRLMRAILVDRQLSGADHAVAWELLDHVDAKKGYSWISRRAIAERAGMWERNVSRSLDRLIKQGYFTATPSRGPGHSATHKPNYEAAKRAVIQPPISDREREADQPGKGVKSAPQRVSNQPWSNSPPNPLSESSYESAYEPNGVSGDSARERWAEAEADSRADHHTHCKPFTTDRRLADKADSVAQTPSASPGEQGSEAEEEQAPPPKPASPRPANGGGTRGFLVNELSRGADRRLHTRSAGSFATVDRARAEAARIMAAGAAPATAEQINAGHAGRWVEIRDPTGDPIPLDDPAGSVDRAAAQR